tara:strand:+ start:4682 stop:6106 length:1425 start_codon:yes stop_codon:yes gene_type:complete
MEIKMNIALVWPKGFMTNAVIPLSLGYLKSNINKKHTVKIVDFSLDNISSNSPCLETMIKDFNPRIVGISCWSITYKEAISILEKVKLINKNILTAIGGVDATLRLNTIIKNKNIDFVFRGEADLSFPEFVEEVQKEKPDLSNISGLTYRSGNGGCINNEIVYEKGLDKIKIPDYDAIRLDDYIKRGYKYNTEDIRNAPIWVTRGCPYRCNFCSAPKQNGVRLRSHSIEYMVKWVKFLYYEKSIRTLNIIDDNFTLELNYAKEFCKAVIKLNLKDLHFATPNGIRIQRTDKELFYLMKQAGWQSITIAPESGSIKTLKRMKKEIDLKIVPDKIQEIKKTGLKVIGFFMVGYPGETEADLKVTAKFIRKCKFDFFFLFNFQPLPGTPIYDELVKSGEIPSDFLPGEYAYADLLCIPKELKNFNFSLFRLKEYLYLAFTNPPSIRHVLTHYDLKFIIERIGTILKDVFLRKIKRVS